MKNDKKKVTKTTKPVAKKTVAKKPVAKKNTAKKVVATKATYKKAVSKEVVAKRPVVMVRKPNYNRIVLVAVIVGLFVLFTVSSL